MIEFKWSRRNKNKKYAEISFPKYKWKFLKNHYWYEINIKVIINGINKYIKSPKTGKNNQKGNNEKVK